MTHPFRLTAFYLFPLIALSEGLSHGTALALARTSEEIVIATDSRVTDANGKALADTCKIRRSGSLYVSMNGQAGGKGGVDFWRLIDKRLSVRGSLANRIASIRDSLAPLLNRNLESDSNARKIANEQGSAMGVSIYGFYKGTLVVYNIRFALKDATHVDPVIRRCPGTDCPDGRVAITAPPPAQSPFDWSINRVTAARQWVQREIDRRLPHIGGPIQLLRIDRSGNRQWIQKPDVCKDQK